MNDLDVVFANHPEHLHAAFYLGRSLRAAGRFDEALEPLRAATASDELAVRAHYELGTCLAQLRHRAEAIRHYEKVLALQPQNAQVAANLGALLERENRLDEAGSFVARALEIDPRNHTARMLRATLDRRTGKSEDAARQLQNLIPELDNAVNRSLAWNQLGQCMEALGDWERAFDVFTESNRLLHETHNAAQPSPEEPHSLETLNRIRAWLKQEPIRDWNPPGENDPGGIAFLVGFPRSGTTLLDRMLRAHPDVEILEEKSLFAELHRNWSEPGVLESLADVNDAQIDDARGIYRRAMSRHRQEPGRALVVDKLPLNLAYVFLIHRLFPQAPILFLQRHPVDACISCFFQSFELNTAMGYFLDLEQTARYYDAVMQVASLSLEQVGSPVHTLRYEDLVTAPKAKLEGLVRFLGIEWNDAVLDYRQAAGGQSSDTPSYQQVSQPLYTQSIGRWRHYRAQLSPVLPIIQPWVDRLGYGPE